MASMPGWASTRRLESCTTWAATAVRVASIPLTSERAPRRWWGPAPFSPTILPSMLPGTRTRCIFDDSLYSVNLSTGAFALVGGLGLGDISSQFGSDFSPTGILWALSDAGEIYTINAGTGAAAFVAQVRLGSLTGQPCRALRDWPSIRALVGRRYRSRLPISASFRDSR